MSSLDPAGPSAQPTLGPLHGLRVLDMSWLLPGPFCTTVLVELGADVIKVERPRGGDYLRDLMPGAYGVVNRGKRSIALDLKSDEDRAVFERLLANADVLVEAFRPGVTRRLGYDWPTLSKRYPRLIYLSLSGYGQDGPLARHPGHDINYLALAGAMSIPGHWNEEPRRSGLPIGDLSAGLYAAINILAALRARDAGGPGAYIDLSIADSVLHWSQVRIADADLSARPPRWHHLQPGNDVFTTADGQRIALGVVEEKFWHRLAEAIGRPGLAAQASVFEHAKDGATRDSAGNALSTFLREGIAAHDLAHWKRILGERDVPFAVVLGPDEAFAAEQFITRGMSSRVDDPTTGRQLNMAALPGRLYRGTSHASSGLAAAAPRLDQHGAALRAELRMQTTATPRTPLADAR
jgi:crotonobetainyl-CoA:carnitine CoA-transferase CaiB-like acyl-CoA transferase